MIQSIRCSRRAAILVLLSAELLLAGWWRWPWTTAPIQTPFDYGTGHVTVVSENWRRFGAVRQHFLPVLSIDPDLPEWPYRGPYSQSYYSVPPLAFILHYVATRAAPGVEPVLLGKVVAQSLIAASTLGAAFFLEEVFGAWAALVGLTFLIWGVPFLLWFANGYFAVNVGLAVQLVFVPWCAAIAARSLRDADQGRLSTAFLLGVGTALAFLGAFADYLPVVANAIAVAGLLCVAACARHARAVGYWLAGAAAGGVLLGTLASGLLTAVLYSRQMGAATYRDAITRRIADRSGHASIPEHFDVIRRQMLTAWPPEVIIPVLAMLGVVVAWCVAALARRRSRREADEAIAILLALAVAIGPSFYFHYRAVSYVSIHWWFAGTWVIGWAMTVCAFVWVARRRLGRGYPLVCIALVGAFVAANVRFTAAQSAVDARDDAVRMYRALGRDLPHDDLPLVVSDLTIDRPGLFEDFPYATAYLRRPVLLRERTGEIRVPGFDGLIGGERVLIGREDVRARLVHRSGEVYIAYDPDARQCYGVDISLSAWHRAMPVNVCRASATALVQAPDTVLGPLDAAYPCSSPPVPPGDLHVVSNSGGTVVISWIESVTRRTSYILEAGRARGQADALTTDVGRATTFTASRVQPGTYYVRVRGRNSCGTGGASNELIVVVE